MKTSCTWLSACAALLLLSLAIVADEPRVVRELSITGNDTIPTGKILECLTRYPAVLAAAERNHSDEEYTRAIEATLREGYKNAGFLESRISVTQTQNTWQAHIEEGPRTLKAAVQIVGNAETSQWLSQAIADYQKDPNKSIWLEGYAWDGDKNLSGDARKHLEQCLVTLGINPRIVTGDITVAHSATSSSPVARLILQIPDAVKPTRIESLRCSTADRELILAELAKHDLALGARVDSTTLARVQKILLASGKFDTVAVKTEPGHGLGDLALNVQGTRCDASADQIVARQKILSFGESIPRLIVDGRGLHLTMDSDGTLGHLWVLETSFAVELAKNNVEIARLFNDIATDKMVIETGDHTRYAFGIPNFEMRFSVTPHETDNEKWNFNFGGDFKTDPKPIRSNQFQLDVSTLSKMFPLAETELAEDKNGLVIQSPRGRLHISDSGEFKSLSVKSQTEPDSVWLLESIDRLPDHVRKLEVTDQDQLAFIIPEKEPDNPNSYKNAFFILNNQKNLVAQATFWLVDEVLKYRATTDIYALAEVFSISNSGDKEAVHAASQRWLAKHTPGPFSTMAIAYSYANASDAQRAADYASEAMQLLTQEASLRHDLDRIFVEGSALGGAANQIDARHLHKVVSEVAKAFEADESVSFALRITEPPAVQSVDQWKFVVARLVPLALQAPMQSIASQLSAGTTRTAARP